jgi:mitochondrial fission protein ELM1
VLRQAGECWVITDHAAGNQRQALALAERLGLPVRHLVLEPRAPWSWLAPRLVVGGRLALPPAQRELFASPWPHVAIGCGRAAALFTRMLRPLAAGTCHTVQILDPRLDPAHWDTVIAPRHDRLHGPNVLTPLGSLNPVDDTWLSDARGAFHELGELPQPRVGVLLGGPRRGIALDGEYAAALAQRLLADHCRDGGSVLVVASRRTPPALYATVRNALQTVPGLHWGGPEDGANPYPGVLAWADRLVVTPDSVNMLSEAGAVGCPVATLVLAPLPAKIARFHRNLHDAGLLAPIGDELGRTHPPLRETAALAQVIRERMAQSGRIDGH